MWGKIDWNKKIERENPAKQKGGWKESRKGETEKLAKDNDSKVTGDSGKNHCNEVLTF